MLCPMYARQFGLTQDPFSIAPDPRFLFMSERHREALAHLMFGLTGTDGQGGGADGGIVLLTGEVGTGKTTICRCLLEHIPANCHVAYVFNPKLSAVELLQTVCEEFHIPINLESNQVPTVKFYIDRLNTFLLESHAAGKTSVLIIDEAQNLGVDVLEQLRLLTNLETSERKLLQIVLIGQAQLRDMLALPELEQLDQRVVARFHLNALTEDESLHYVAHRMAVAGHVGRMPFDIASLRRIHRLAEGVPRRINQLCDRALLGAWSQCLQQVNSDVVEKAAAEVLGKKPPPSQRQRHTHYLVGAVAAVLIGLTAMWMLWRQPPDKSAQTTSAQQKAESAPVAASPAIAVSAATSAAVPAAPAASSPSSRPTPKRKPN